MSVMGYVGDQVGAHKDHADALEVACYPSFEEPASITVECARCGEVVAELWNADAQARAVEAARRALEEKA